MNIIGLSGSLSAPSRTRALVAAVIGEISRQTGHGGPVIDIADIAADLGRTLGSFVLPPAIEAAHGQLRAADLIVIGVPVYKASYPGAFKHFLDLLDPKALEGKSAILVATGGSDQHALILEHQLRASPATWASIRRPKRCSPATPIFPTTASRAPPLPSGWPWSPGRPAGCCARRPPTGWPRRPDAFIHPRRSP
jgi:MsuE subfamily FMN reductase